MDRERRPAVSSLRTVRLLAETRATDDEADRPWRRKRLILIATAIGLQAFLGIATNVNKWRSWFSPAPAIVEDTDIYYRYASRVLSGTIPYRDFLVEYPPLALPVFVLPRLLTPSLAWYKVAFAAEMMLFQAATVYLLADLAGTDRSRKTLASRLLWLTVNFVLLSRLILSRYDAAPTFLAFSAAVCWSAGRDVRAGTLAALGTLMKVFPAAVALVGVWREEPDRTASKRRGVLVFATLCLLGAIAWLGLGGRQGVVHSLAYQLGRGLEYGSLYSGLQLLVAKLSATAFTISRDHGSFSSVTPWTKFLVRLAFPVQLSMMLGACLAFQRRGRQDIVRYAAAAILGFIIGGKVFSPQYLIWLVPFVTALEGPIGRPARWIFAAGCASVLLAPAQSGFLSRSDVWLILFYNLRNLLFLGLWILLVFGTSRALSEEALSKPERLPMPRSMDRRISRTVDHEQPAEVSRSSPILPHTRAKTDAQT